MSEAGREAGDLAMESFLDEPLPGSRPAARAPGLSGDLGLSECLEGRNQVALRLACIGDEMDRRLQGPRLARLPGMAMHSLALTYSQTGVGGVLRSLVHGLTNLRENGRSWAPRAARPRVSPAPAWACRRLLPALLAALLLGGALHLLLQ